MLPTTRNVFASALLGVMPQNPVDRANFGIATREHFHALSFGVLSGEITAKALEAAMGDGPKLTKLVRGAASNPFKEITFRTDWDLSFPGEKKAAIEMPVKGRVAAKVIDFDMEK
jgi:hypothetical protein